MGADFGQAGIFLVSTLFGLYILAVLLRLMFQIARADFYNPLSQFLVMITNPPLLPLRRVIPGLGGIDLASVVLLVLLQVLELYLLGALRGRTPQLPGVMVLSVAQLLGLVISVFFFAIIIRVIMSWVNPYSRNPLMDLVLSVTEPVMRPARRVIPLVGGLDLSPVVVLIVLQLSQILIVQPLTRLAFQLGA